MSDGSVTIWIRLLRDDQREAAQRLWDRYFQRLTFFARRKLLGASMNVEDEEDVAIMAFTTFCSALAAGRMDDVNNRDDLWRTLALMAAGKAVDLRRRQSAKKRGLETDADGNAIGNITDPIALEQAIGTEEDPGLAAEMGEEFERLMTKLPERLRMVAQWKLEGYTNQEIASLTGRSVRTVARELTTIRTAWSGGEIEE